jgi:uncharacterized cupredoxin-like copper-binding protein
VLIALTTGHKIGLAVFAIVFVVFALLSAMLIPRFRPEFPGRALPFFLLATIALFGAMLTAVIVFGRESEEAEAGKETQTETGGTKTVAGTGVAVQESEFKIVLPGGQTTLKPGAYELDVMNKGKIDHDLVVDGPGVDNEKTSLIAAGKTATLDVTLKPGTYDFYCSVDGHKQAGMDLKVKVS